MARLKYNHPMRKSPRAKVVQSAYIARENGELLGPCTMIDVSVGGAKLEVKVPASVPERFILLLSKDGRVQRQCRLAWRGPRGVGVQFLKPPIKQTAV